MGKGQKRVLISDPTDKVCFDVLTEAGVHGVRGSGALQGRARARASHFGACR